MIIYNAHHYLHLISQAVAPRNNYILAHFIAFKEISSNDCKTWNRVRLLEILQLVDKKKCMKIFVGVIKLVHSIFRVLQGSTKYMER